ncbi:RNA 2',3'-cyclic phosphodiesterase [Bacillus sp. CMF12]|uniref:RNA 2',3'-cyclic phosphodiesterase n=1 Tax=Bacillaceae TaxID=186817 RepID=UPI001FB443BA|nr:MULTISPECIES: RNA 2',3'-cyclic phosphodiesterase [Bacillaceae]UOE54737.1 RNA 2',3'-cyclic phosphodiesterase [Cytobacillus oceanisediminis]USK49242.1 RNA 2',3'-cyclic phosphodiesterase [Bacillus sp. CMF12]
MSKQLNDHFFFALKLPDEIKGKLKEYCGNLSSKLPFSRWVHHEDYHITLAFLGSAPQENLQKAAKLVADSIRNEKRFPLHICKLGVFGKQDAPRIFWCGTQQDKHLQELRSKVYSACQEAGFELETRPFKPHITMARKWAGTHPFQESMLDDNSPFIDGLLEFKASEVVLYQTHLDKTPKYESIAIFPLLAE